MSKRFFVWTGLLWFVMTPSIFAQHTYRALVVDEHDSHPLVGVNVVVVGTIVGGATDAEGRVTLTGIPAGEQMLLFSYVGFEELKLTVTFPLPDPSVVAVIEMEEGHEHLEEVSVTAARTSRTIADQPSRVETIAGEEIDEKISMEPSNITMLLNESPGITVQQTSAVSGNASIRIQGLDGRYTQLLKDGFPLYGGFSGGLSLLQVPPLDLLQVEIIKGPASTLYGGDAIAGLVNLVSKTPTETPERSVILNATSAQGFDLGGFFSGRNQHWGGTLLLSGNLQQAYDPDNDNLANLPQSRRLTIHPRMFYYPSANTIVSLGVAGTFEQREGGTTNVIEGRSRQGFLRVNTSTRLTSQARLDHQLTSGARLTLKNSVTYFDRGVEDRWPFRQDRFDGNQVATYSEVSMLLERDAADVVLGLDMRSDAFSEADPVEWRPLDYTYISMGAFGQYTRDFGAQVVIEGGLRTEYHGEFGFFVLPKASVLYRMTDQLSARVGGGLGYQAPTVTLEPPEGRKFDDVWPLNDDVEAENSAGGSFDMNYRTLLFDRVTLSLNQAFYFTNLRDPIVAIGTDHPGLRYRNASGAIRTRALETNAKLSYGDLKLFLGYVYLNIRTDYTAEEAMFLESYIIDYIGEGQSVPLTPAHKTYTVLVYEKHGDMRIGLEAYYTGAQRLSNGDPTEGYWVLGLMGERRVGFARFFLNFENFLDTKQANFGDVSRFSEIWAPMDGFIVNGGVKYAF